MPEGDAKVEVVVPDNTPNVFATRSASAPRTITEAAEREGYNPDEEESEEPDEEPEEADEETGDEEDEGDEAGEGTNESDEQESGSESAEIEELRKQVEAFKAITDGLANDPASTLAELIDVLSKSDPKLAEKVAAKVGLGDAGKQDDLAAYPQDIADQARALEKDPKAYEPQSGMEAYLLRHIDTIRDLPKTIEQIGTTFGEVGRVVDDHAIELAALRETLAAVIGMQGGEMPGPIDKAKVVKMVQGGKSLQDAIKEVYGKDLKKALEVARQKAVSRPETLANGSGGRSARNVRVTSIKQAAELLSSGRG